MKRIFFLYPIFLFALLLVVFMPRGARAQIAPGPYEVLPFEDGFIVEAFFDLQSGTSRADWSGWSGTTWISPNAYDGHQGTDIAVQTGTPLFSIVSGVVTEVVTHLPKNDRSTSYGNYVRIAADAPSPNGEALDLLYLHMWVVTATNGQRVNIGDQVGLSDNTGNSTSEHIHIQSEIRGTGAVCPLYWGHYKYPIMFNPLANHQIGHVVKVKSPTSMLRTDRFDSSAAITNVHQDQVFFASYAKRGYYQIFIPNSTSFRSGWVRATDVEEIYTGTVIHALPDKVTYSHTGQLQTNYILRAQPDDSSAEVGRIRFGGGRFVADQVTNGFYRVAIPGSSAVWGWVKPNHRMIVYPQLYHPSIDPAALPYKAFPIKESFATVGKSMFGRPKFNRSVVKEFSPSSPGGDGKALFITDASNSGNGLAESILVGKPGDQNYFVQSDLYFNYQPSYINASVSRYEQYGIFLRDDGFAGMTHTFEGGGNGYALLWDNHNGQLRAGRLVDAAITGMAAVRTVTSNGWHTLRIEAQTNQLRFYFDQQLLLQTNDTTFPSGQAGLGYRWYQGSPSSYPAARGAYFDNFVADTLDPVPLRFKQISLADGGARLLISGTVGTSNLIERTSSLLPGDWFTLTTAVHSNSVIELEDPESNLPCRFYRARQLP